MAEKKVECPKCWVPLDIIKEDVWGPDIDIDVCPKCNGVWLDPGELKKILKDNDLSDYLTNQNAILHNVKTRLLQWKGDCFYAIDEGVDYNNLLDVGTKTLLDSDVKRIILQSEGVIKINNDMPIYIEKVSKLKAIQADAQVIAEARPEYNLRKLCRVLPFGSRIQGKIPIQF